MKSSIFLFILLFTLVSCGEKGDAAKTSFNLRLGATVTNPSAFAGGLIITGRNLEGTQKFTLALTNDLIITLPKGAWEFATIAWPSPIGGKKMTGPHTCSYKNVELRDDDQTVTFNMNLNNCNSAALGRSEVFSSSYYYSILNSGSSTIGFKKLVLTECTTIDINGSCAIASASSTYQSFRVGIPSFSNGVIASSMQDLSQCEPITSGLRYSDFQLPIGGPNGFIRTNIKMYQTPNCVEDGTPTSSFSYPKGFANAVPNYSMTSSISNASLANTNYNYISTWNIGGVISTSDRLKGDIYLINATSTTVPSANPGDFAYFDGSTFQMLPGGIMSLIDGKIYFNDNNVYQALIMAIRFDRFIYHIIFIFFILITTLPLIYSLDFYFPYVAPRSFMFRFLVEIQIILFLIISLKDKTYLPQFNLASFSIFFAMSVLFVANIWGENPTKSFWGNFERMDGFNGFVHLACFFLMAQSILKTKKHWAIITHASIVIALIVSILGVRELLTEPSAFISSTLGNASYLAIYIVFHIFITAIFFFSSKNKIHKSLYAFVILFFVFIVYNTGSRGCFLALIVGLSISIIFTKDFKIIKKIIIPFIFLFTFSISFIWLFKDYAFIKNNSTYVRIIDFNSATSTRSKLWSIAFEGIKQKPALGWGQENFELVFDKYYKPTLGDAEDWFDRVHNSFLDWSISGGLFGGLAYILLFALPLYLLWKSNENKMKKSIIVGMIGAYLVYSTFMFDHLMSQLYYFFTLAYIANLSGSDQKNLSPLGSQLTVISFAIFLSYTAIFINFPAYKSAKVLGQLLYTNDFENKKSLDEVIHLAAQGSFGKREIIEQTMTLAYTLPTDKRLEFLEKISPEISNYKIFRFSFFNISMVDDIEKAQEHFEIALKYSPGRQITYYALIKFYLRIKNYQKALHYSQLAYQLNPDINRSKIIHALCLIFNNEVKGSDEALKDVPFDLYANNTLFITAYSLANRQDKIVTHLKKMIQIYPHRIEIYTQLGMLLSEMGFEEEALQVFKESQKVTQEQLLQ